MEYIDITEKLEEFYRHLSADGVDRTIFSAKFGDGKTEFLRQFKEKYKKKYTFYTLYPVNYQIAPNGKIMEYIKRDLLFQLILNGMVTPIDDIPDSILLQWYVDGSSFDIIKDMIKFVPSIIESRNKFAVVLKGAIALAEGIRNRCKKFKEFKTKIRKGDFENAIDFIEKLSEGAGNIYELDFISWLIAQSIAKQDRKSVLIIEDLDRIDPAHLFRILNVFSAHIDRQYLCSNKTIYQDDKEKLFDELPDKFGFAKVIFVMDADATRTTFEKFYGKANYDGYISKFLSKRIFYYSIILPASIYLYNHIREKCGINKVTFDKGLKAIGFKIEQKSIRDIAKVLDNFENAYRRVEVRLTEDFCFLSDTPLVKLLAILNRLGIKRDQLSAFFKAIQDDEDFIELSDCFAMNIKLIYTNKHISHNGKLYQIVFDIDQYGYKTFKRVKTTSNIKIANLNIPFKNYIHDIIKTALFYVN